MDVHPDNLGVARTLVGLLGEDGKVNLAARDLLEQERPADADALVMTETLAGWISLGHAPGIISKARVAVVVPV
jgi:hypothetical protein